MHALSALNSLDPATQNRALAICVGASIALHAAVLFLLPGMREGGKPASQAQVLSATFAPRTSVPYIPPQPVVVPTPPKPEPQRPQPKTEAPRPVLTAPTPSSTPSPQVAPAPPVAAPSPPVAPAPQAAPSPPRGAEPPAASSAPVGAPSDAADAGSLDKYRLDLIVAARRYKRYPAQAMEKGWQGKVEVRLLIGPDGRIKTASIKTTSGFSLLDQTALDMITKGKPLTQIPVSLRGKEFVVDVPVIFDLQTG